MTVAQPLRKRGKQAPGFDPAVLHWSQLHSARGRVRGVQIPQSIDWFKGIDRAKLGTLGNAYDPSNPTAPVVGDCGVAGMYRLEQAWDYQVKSSFVPGDQLLPCALQAYSEISGWNPNDPSTDQGIVLLNGLKYWLTKGIPWPDGTRRKIVGFFQVDHRVNADIRQVVAECGGAYVGQTIPDAYDTSNEGDIWDLEGPGNGGHCTDIMAYDPNDFDMESWAMRFAETLRAKDAYMDEAWAVVSPTWAKATGKTPFNMTLDEVEASMQPLRMAA